jgi:hypothetical protein
MSELTTMATGGLTPRDAKLYTLDSMGDPGKIRSFWGYIGLGVITLGIYHFVWYSKLNHEQRAIGVGKADPVLSGSRPAKSVTALVLGSLFCWLVLPIIPIFVSLWGFSGRIARAEAVAGIPKGERLKKSSYLLLFPFGIFVIPTWIWLYLIVKHQNAAIRAAGVPVA